MRISRSNVQEDVKANVLAAVPITEVRIRRDLAPVFRKDKALSRAALAYLRGEGAALITHSPSGWSHLVVGPNFELSR
jgi:hypothetical protein